MYINANTIIVAASLLGACVTIIGSLFAVYRWYLKMNKNDAEIKKIKAEQCLITYGILAALKGLQEQGCNGAVTKTIDKIEKHINLEAHDQEE